MKIRKINKTAQHKRVAAYARVSTLAEQQEESFESQLEYYTRLIGQTKEWELVEVFADQGASGLSAKRRPDFMRMIECAHAGKIDLILCKSISRFSRNFMEIQQYVHDLKQINVEVWFQKEGIRSFDPNADLLFGTLAAVTQEESRAISNNVKWSYRRMAELGIRHIGNNRMLGYDEIEGKLVPNGDAWIVRLMFEEYAKGASPTQLLAALKESGAKRLRSQRDYTWSSVLCVLKNEVYVGDRHIQKRPPKDFLTHKPDYTKPYDSKYIYDDHEPVISREVWQAVQERLGQDYVLRRQDGTLVRNSQRMLTPNNIILNI